VVLLPNNESKRLSRLEELRALDETPESIFNTIAKLASDICGVEIAAISLIDDDRQWFKTTVGMDDVAEIGSDVSICAQAVLNGDVLHFNDIQDHAAFDENPLVKNPPNIRFYAGAPLKLYGDLNVGALCIMDPAPQPLSGLHKRLLKGLAEIASNALAMRQAARDELNNQSNKLAVIVQSSEDAVLSKTLADVVTTWNPAATKLFAHYSRR